ncbi:unnamed protein product [Vicia faba]|uniref:Uncharacterized protein n=1 Tax=Vicia faba TaxID=3906 RepID=A0AAV0ZMM2_VICFA|nr:unnamed protein product [Vicia faba]
MVSMMRDQCEAELTAEFERQKDMSCCKSQKLLVLNRGSVDDAACNWESGCTMEIKGGIEVGLLVNLKMEWSINSDVRKVVVWVEDEVDMCG